MRLIPNRFLFRLAYPCRYVKEMPREGEDEALLELAESCRIDNFAPMDGQTNFADVRLAWNEFGIGMQVDIRGKEQPPQGDRQKPRSSDGVTVWIDTRGDRTFHRASRYCHQFHFLAAGAGVEKDEPAFAQSKIHRALQDAPLVDETTVPFRCEPIQGGYRLSAFLPAGALNGFDPQEHSLLGFYYAIRDFELGEQTLGPADFPFAEDPSLWASLDLVR